MLEIDSIESVTVQGMTKPLISQADDGKTYLVKYANGVTVNGLVKEWLAACLAQDLGFNIPEFVPAFISQELINAFPNFAKHEVVSKPIEGVVFASEWQALMDEFKLINVEEVSLERKINLLIFDLWIGNDDRSLTEKGGNVNLLWSIQKNDFYVIDHNLAFQDKLENDFLSTHVFRDSAKEPCYFDLVEREGHQLKLQKTLEKWDNYLSSCPKEWLENELFDLDLGMVYRQLLEDAHGNLWNKLR